MTLVKERISTVMYAVMGAILMAAPLLAGAQTGGFPDPGQPSTDYGSQGAFFDALFQIFQFAYTLLFIAAAFLILWAAFTYLTAGGNEEKVEEAKNRLVYAIIAIVVGLLALGLPTLVQSIFTGTA